MRTNGTSGKPEISEVEAASLLNALAHSGRLAIFRLLVRYLPYGLPAGDIGRLLAVAHNTLSAQLASLHQVGLVHSRREGRSIIYSADPRRIQDIMALIAGPPAAARKNGDGAELPYDRPFKRPPAEHQPTCNVLVVCTGNSVRSIFAEAILNREGGGRLRGYSAGSRPEKVPHPDALSLLQSLGYDLTACRSKSWSEFAQPMAPRMNFVITVCDVAAQETLPALPGNPPLVHWGIANPGGRSGPVEAQQATFLDAYRHMAMRMTALVNLDRDKLDPANLHANLLAIGSMEGATEMALKGWMP